MAQCRKCARFDHCGMVWKRLGEEAEDVTCVGFDPVRTNADRIRAMTDEELADYMHRILANVAGNPEICPSISFLEHWLEQEAEEGEWLKKEAQDD